MQKSERAFMATEASNEYAENVRPSDSPTRTELLMVSISTGGFRTCWAATNNHRQERKMKVRIGAGWCLLFAFHKVARATSPPGFGSFSSLSILSYRSFFTKLLYCHHPGLRHCRRIAYATRTKNRTRRKREESQQPTFKPNG